MGETCPKCGRLRGNQSSESEPRCLSERSWQSPECRLIELTNENAKLCRYKEVFDMLCGWMEGYQETNELDKEKTRQADAYINAWKKLNDENAALKAQLAADRGIIQGSQDRAADLQRQLDEARRELDELKKPPDRHFWDPQAHE